MFQFSGFAHLSMYYVFNIVGCPIRISTDQFVCANPRSFSQLITSFFASESLGIPHTPLISLLLFVLNTYLWYAFFFLYFLYAFFSYFSLSQYVNERFGSSIYFLVHTFITLVENIGVEPMTSCVQGRRSSQLS